MSERDAQRMSEVSWQRDSTDEAVQLQQRSWTAVVGKTY